MSALTVQSYATSNTRGSVKRDSFVSEHDGKTREWLTGTVTTHWGIVTVYSQSGEKPWSHYSVVMDGRIYYGSEPMGRSKRGLAVRAAKFARDVYAQAVA